MSTTIMSLHRQWATRQDDERFVSMDAMLNHLEYIEGNSQHFAVARDSLRVEPNGNDILVSINNKAAFVPTHYAFNQFAQKIGTSPDFVRDLPPRLIADVMNYHLAKGTALLPSPSKPGFDFGLSTANKSTDLSVLVQRGEVNDNDDPDCHSLRAVLGSRYGRIPNYGVVKFLADNVCPLGFTIPGEYGKEVAITKANTTLYASDRDIFLMLANEKDRVELPKRRNGKPGSFARGFIVSNSEVGARKFACQTFYYDYVCANRMIWGAEEIVDISIKHSSSAPERFAREFLPQIKKLIEADTSKSFLEAIAAAKAKKLTDDKCAEIIGNIAGKRKVLEVYRAHEADEGRPIETLYDVTNGLTAWSRGIKNADDRTAVEVAAGKLLAKAA